MLSPAWYCMHMGRELPIGTDVKPEARWRQYGPQTQRWRAPACFLFLLKTQVLLCQKPEDKVHVLTILASVHNSGSITPYGKLSEVVL